MAVLLLYQWLGDPEVLLAAYDVELQHPIIRDQPRRLSHTCARADDGMVIVDLWESMEDIQRMRDDPEFQRNLKAAGTPEPDVMQVCQVHATVP